MSLQHDEWVVVPYRDEWPELYAREAKRLRGVFAGTDAHIEHIGSTSVPGLGAKPIIDIMIGVAALAEAEARIAALAGLGYEYVPEFEDVLPQRRYFRRPIALPRTHHLHVIERTTAFWRDHLRFRDYLRAHPEAASEYFQLKVRLIGECAETGEDYTDAKSPFIQSVIEKAAIERE